MDAFSDEPTFCPLLFEVSPSCSWKFNHESTLSANEWFITGPGPGVYREDWLRDAHTFREQVRAGKGRVIEMDARKKDAWLRFATPVSEALALGVGDSFYIALKVRVIEGKDVSLNLCCTGSGKDVEALDNVAAIAIPADGIWHEVETTVITPNSLEPGELLSPGVLLKHAVSEMPLRVEVSRVIVGINDVNRMRVVSSVVNNAGDAHLCRSIYDREDIDWLSSVFTQYVVPLYDHNFYSPESGYQVEAFIEDKRRRFGGVDSVILLPVPLTTGMNDCNPSDFFRDLPDGLEGIHSLCQQFQKSGVRVLLSFLPSKQDDSIADMKVMTTWIRDLGVDGIFLDSSTGIDPKIYRRLYSEKQSVILMSNLHSSAAHLSLCNASWTQLPPNSTSHGMPLLKWIEPRHRQYYRYCGEEQQRWKMEIAFFNGEGLLFWENNLDTGTSCIDSDTVLWKRCSKILRLFSHEFQSELWDPFYPSLNDDLCIHRWPGVPTTLFTLYNTGEPIEHGPLMRWQLPSHVRADDMQIRDLWNGCDMRWDMSEFGWVQVWGNVKQLGCIAVTFVKDSRIEELLLPRTP